MVLLVLTTPPPAALLSNIRWAGEGGGFSIAEQKGSESHHLKIGFEIEFG